MVTGKSYLHMLQEYVVQLHTSNFEDIDFT